MRYLYDWNYEFDDTEDEETFDLGFAALLLRLPCKNLKDIYVSTFSGQVKYPSDAMESQVAKIAGEELAPKLVALGAQNLHRDISDCIYLLNRDRPPFDSQRMLHEFTQLDEELEKTYTQADRLVAEKPNLLRERLYKVLKIPPVVMTAKGQPSVSMEALKRLAEIHPEAARWYTLKKKLLTLNRLAQDVEEIYWPTFLRANEWYRARPFSYQDYLSDLSSCVDVDFAIVGNPGLKTEHLVDALEGTKFFKDMEDCAVTLSDNEIWDALLLKASTQNVDQEDFQQMMKLAQDQEKFARYGTFLEQYPELGVWLQEQKDLYERRGAIRFEGVEIPVECFQPNNSAQFLMDWIVVHENIESLRLCRDFILAGVRAFPYLGRVVVFSSNLSAELLSEAGVQRDYEFQAKVFAG